MGTEVVLVIVIIAVVLAVKSMVKDKRQGKSLQCGGDCKHCGGGCHSYHGAAREGTITKS